MRQSVATKPLKKMAERVESGNEEEFAGESAARRGKHNFSVNEISELTQKDKIHLALSSPN